EKKLGHKPARVRCAVDALAVWVNQENPLPGLTLAQVDAVFSKGRRRGAPREIVTWGQLGLAGEWADRPIRLYGRNAASGTHAFFKEHVLEDGDYRDEVKAEAGSAAVVQDVSADRYAIGYTGIGFATGSVRAVPLSEKGAQVVEANIANAYAGTYPLSRFLFI